MLHIWGRISSINVRKVVWAVQYLNLTHQRTDAGGQFGLVQTPDYLARNPNALVPLIDDEGYSLWESNVILRYLCARYAPDTLYPQDLKARFDAERWMDWQQTTLNPAGRDAFVQLIRKPGGQVDVGKVEASIEATTPLLDLLNTHLARQAFMAGTHLTMADIPIACEVHRWRGIPLAHQPRLHLDRWYQHMLALPASRGVLDIVLS